MRKLGSILSVVGLGLLTGGMLFFPIMTLLLFTRLPMETAGPFVRGCFPVYYAYMLVFSVLSGLGFALRGKVKTALGLVVVSLTTLWLWFWLIPYLEAARLNGNHVAFNHGHTLSVWIDGIEFVFLLGLMIRESLITARA